MEDKEHETQKGRPVNRTLEMALLVWLGFFMYVMLVIYNPPDHAIIEASRKLIWPMIYRQYVFAD